MNSNPFQRPTRTTWARTALGLAGIALTIALAGCAPTTPAGAPTGASSGAASGGNSGGSSGGGAAKELDACSLLSAGDASTLVGETLSAGVSTTIAPGQDQCAYHSDSSVGLTVIIYQPASGVSWSVLLDGSSADKAVSGVGDKAKTDGVVELDVQAGTHLIAVQNPSDTGRIAVAKHLVGALK